MSLLRLYTARRLLHLCFSSTLRHHHHHHHPLTHRSSPLWHHTDRPLPLTVQFPPVIAPSPVRSPDISIRSFGSSARTRRAHLKTVAVAAVSLADPFIRSFVDSLATRSRYRGAPPLLLHRPPRLVATYVAVSSSASSSSARSLPPPLSLPVTSACPCSVVSWRHRPLILSWLVIRFQRLSKELHRIASHRVASHLV